MEENRPEHVESVQIGKRRSSLGALSKSKPVTKLKSMFEAKGPAPKFKDSGLLGKLRPVVSSSIDSSTFAAAVSASMAAAATNTVPFPASFEQVPGTPPDPLFSVLVPPVEHDTIPNLSPPRSVGEMRMSTPGNNDSMPDGSEADARSVKSPGSAGFLKRMSSGLKKALTPKSSAGKQKHGGLSPSYAGSETSNVSPRPSAQLLMTPSSQPSSTSLDLNCRSDQLQSASGRSPSALVGYEVHSERDDQDLTRTFSRDVTVDTMVHHISSSARPPRSPSIQPLPPCNVPPDGAAAQYEASLLGTSRDVVPRSQPNSSPDQSQIITGIISARLPMAVGGSFVNCANEVQAGIAVEVAAEGVDSCAASLTASPAAPEVSEGSRASPPMREVNMGAAIFSVPLFSATSDGTDASNSMLGAQGVELVFPSLPSSHLPITVHALEVAASVAAADEGPAMCDPCSESVDIDMAAFDVVAPAGGPMAETSSISPLLNVVGMEDTNVLMSSMEVDVTTDQPVVQQGVPLVSRCSFGAAASLNLDLNASVAVVGSPDSPDAMTPQEYSAADNCIIGLTPVRPETAAKCVMNEATPVLSTVAEGSPEALPSSPRAELRGLDLEGDFNQIHVLVAVDTEMAPNHDTVVEEPAPITLNDCTITCGAEEGPLALPKDGTPDCITLPSAAGEFAIVITDITEGPVAADIDMDWDDDAGSQHEMQARNEAQQHACNTEPSGCTLAETAAHQPPEIASEELATSVKTALLQFARVPEYACTMELVQVVLVSPADSHYESAQLQSNIVVDESQQGAGEKLFSASVTTSSLSGAMGSALDDGGQCVHSSPEAENAEQTMGNITIASTSAGSESNSISLDVADASNSALGPDTAALALYASYVATPTGAKLHDVGQTGVALVTRLEEAGDCTTTSVGVASSFPEPVPVPEESLVSIATPSAAAAGVQSCQLAHCVVSSDTSSPAHDTDMEEIRPCSAGKVCAAPLCPSISASSADTSKYVWASVSKSIDAAAAEWSPLARNDSPPCCELEHNASAPLAGNLLHSKESPREPLLNEVSMTSAAEGEVDLVIAVRPTDLLNTGTDETTTATSLPSQIFVLADELVKGREYCQKLTLGVPLQPPDADCNGAESVWAFGPVSPDCAVEGVTENGVAVTGAGASEELEPPSARQLTYAQDYTASSDLPSTSDQPVIDSGIDLMDVDSSATGVQLPQASASPTAILPVPFVDCVPSTCRAHTDAAPVKELPVLCLTDVAGDPELRGYAVPAAAGLAKLNILPMGVMGQPMDVAAFCQSVDVSGALNRDTLQSLGGTHLNAAQTAQAMSEVTAYDGVPDDPMMVSPMPQRLLSKLLPVVERAANQALLEASLDASALDALPSASNCTGMPGPVSPETAQQGVRAFQLDDVEEPDAMELPATDEVSNQPQMRPQVDEDVSETPDGLPSPLETISPVIDGLILASATATSSTHDILLSLTADAGNGAPVAAASITGASFTACEPVPSQLLSDIAPALPSTPAPPAAADGDVAMADSIEAIDALWGNDDLLEEPGNAAANISMPEVGSPSVKQSHSPVLSLSSHKVSPGVVLQVQRESLDLFSLRNSCAARVSDSLMVESLDSFEGMSVCAKGRTIGFIPMAPVKEGDEDAAMAGRATGSEGGSAPAPASTGTQSSNLTFAVNNVGSPNALSTLGLNAAGAVSANMAETPTANKPAAGARGGAASSAGNQVKMAGPALKSASPGGVARGNTTPSTALKAMAAANGAGSSTAKAGMPKRPLLAATAQPKSSASPGQLVAGASAQLSASRLPAVVASPGTGTVRVTVATPGAKPPLPSQGVGATPGAAPGRPGITPRSGAVFSSSACHFPESGAFRSGQSTPHAAPGGRTVAREGLFDTPLILRAAAVPLTDTPFSVGDFDLDTVDISAEASKAIAMLGGGDTGKPLADGTATQHATPVLAPARGSVIAGTPTMLVFETHVQLLTSKLAEAEANIHELQDENAMLRDQLSTLQFENSMTNDLDMERDARQFLEQELAVLRHRADGLEADLRTAHAEGKRREQAAGELLAAQKAKDAELAKQEADTELRMQQMTVETEAARALAQQADGRIAEAEARAAAATAKCDEEMARSKELQATLGLQAHQLVQVQRARDDAEAKFQRAMEQLIAAQTSHKKAVDVYEQKLLQSSNLVSQFNEVRDKYRQMKQHAANAEQRAQHTEAKAHEAVTALGAANIEKAELMRMCNELLTQLEATRVKGER